MVDTSKVFLFKKETVYGTDPVPTAAANAVLARNFTTNPVLVDRLARNIDRPVRGATKDAPSNARQTASYELELAGSGTAGTAPPWMEHLECCGMAAPVVVAATSATQSFVAYGAALSSGTAHSWHGNQKRVGVGGRGSYAFDFTAGAYPFLKLDMTLLLPATPLADATATAPVLTRWKDPLEVNTDNTDFLLDGYAAILKSFTGEISADVKARNLVGGNYVQRGNHELTGRIVCEAPTIAAKNYFQTLRTGGEVVAQIIHGTIAGSIVQADLAHVQITSIELQEEDDVLMLSMAYRANVGSTPDDLIWTAK